VVSFPRGMDGGWRLIFLFLVLIHNLGSKNDHWEEGDSFEAWGRGGGSDYYYGKERKRGGGTK
jgi:hypothetical protein